MPGRSAIISRLRAPFWLIPGSDLLIAGPILAFTSPADLQKMAVQAATGDSCPGKVASPLPSAVSNRPRSGVRCRLLSQRQRPSTDFLDPRRAASGFNPDNAQIAPIRLPDLRVSDFPHLSQSQSSDLIIQPYAGFDTPISSSVVKPARAPNPRLDTIGTAGVPVLFDWRPGWRESCKRK